MPTVRPATAADADAIGRVHAETWRAAYTDILPESAFDVAERRRWWRESLARGRGGVFLAEVDDEVVGFASVGAARDEPDAVGELYAIYVDPRRWGTGAGRALIERAEESLRASGSAEAVLWVLEGNERAERFYRAAGWVHDGGRKVEEFQGAKLTEVRYRKRL
ncbi:MAG TPA: GNAT family N-acetyltransferase [Gaiellaceae bacterium]|nr:GNAT family N-acetyltransferase [Gaiellaceae bacterium]